MLLKHHKSTSFLLNKKPFTNHKLFPIFFLTRQLQEHTTPISSLPFFLTAIPSFQQPYKSMHFPNNKSSKLFIEPYTLPFLSVKKKPNQKINIDITRCEELKLKA
jgi:hypothetical protein